jgi:hypothetical protein
MGITSEPSKTIRCEREILAYEAESTTSKWKSIGWEARTIARAAEIIWSSTIVPRTNA